jgi:hypothetical protein
MIGEPLNTADFSDEKASDRAQVLLRAAPGVC